MARASEDKLQLVEAQVRVLVIEDSEEAMLFVQYALQDYGDGQYSLLWAPDLQSGIDQLSKGGIDVVLLDLDLPDGTGPSSYSWVHRKVRPEVPVLVLTGDRREETEFSALARGADDYLVKSDMSGLQLVHAIEAALDLSKRRASGMTASAGIW